MLLGLIWFLFVFCLGGVVFLAAGAVGAWYFLQTLEKKSEDKKNALVEQRALSIAAESQKAVSVLMPELKSKAKLVLGDKPKSKGEVKILPWTVIVLKSNMLFRFEGEESTTGSIGRLDGCTIKVHPYHNKSRWSPKSAIEITTPDERDLFPDVPGSSCYLYLPLAREAEQWFHALRRATGLTEVKEPAVLEKLQSEHRYFNHLASHVVSGGTEVHADWFNAILGRVFWGIHDQKLFLDFVKSKLEKKISKLKLPSMVDTLKLTEVKFGPNLPLFSNIKLNSFSPLGAMNADGDVHYHGGFFFRIDIQLKITVPVTKNIIYVPVSVKITIKTVAGRMNFQCAPPPAGRGWIAFYGEPNVDLDISTEIGSFSNFKLANIPRLMNIIINKVKGQLIKKMVVPVMDDYPIPKVPKKFTRGEAVKSDPSPSANVEAKEKTKEGAKEKDQKQSDKGKEPSKEKEKDRKPPTPQRNPSSSSLPVNSPSSQLTHRKVYQAHSAAIPPALPRRPPVVQEKPEKRKSVQPKVQEMKEFSKPKPQSPAPSSSDTGAKPIPTTAPYNNLAESTPPLPAKKTEPQSPVPASLFGISPPQSTVPLPVPRPAEEAVDPTPRLSTSPSESKNPVIETPLRSSVPGLFEDPPEPLFEKKEGPKKENLVVDFSTPSLFGPSPTKKPDTLKELTKPAVSAGQSPTQEKPQEPKENATKPKEQSQKETAGVEPKSQNSEEETPSVVETKPSITQQQNEPTNKKEEVLPMEPVKSEAPKPQEENTKETVESERNQTEEKQVAETEPVTQEKTPKQEVSIVEIPPKDSVPTLATTPPKSSLFPDPPSPLFATTHKEPSRNLFPDPLFASTSGGIFSMDSDSSNTSSRTEERPSLFTPPPLPKRPTSVPPLPARTQQPPAQNPLNPAAPSPPLPARPSSQPAGIQKYPPTTSTTPAVPVPVPMPVSDNPLALLASQPKDEDEEEYVLPEPVIKPQVYAKDKFEADMKEKGNKTKHLSILPDHSKDKFRTTSPLLSSDSFLYFDSETESHPAPPQPKKASPDPFVSFLPLSQSGPVRHETKPTTSAKPPSNTSRKGPAATSPPGAPGAPGAGGNSVFNKDFFGNIFNNVEGKGLDFLKEKVEVLKEKADGSDWFFSDKKSSQRESKQL